jgi:predicted alpha/beta superfamily hydrolase
MGKTIFNIVSSLFLLMMIQEPLSAQQDSITVTFVVHARVTGDSAVYITGSHEQLAGWDPGRIAMQQAGTGVWRKVIRVASPVSIEYKFTLGDWRHEAADEAGRPLSNFRARITKDTTITYVVLNWTQGQRKVIHGQVTGTVKHHRAMKGAGIPDRDVIVWLPPGYDERSESRYPVVYMHDGQNLFDPTTSAFGVDWRIDETADSLIRMKLIQPVIIVGICNSPDRMKEYLPGIKGTAYMDFVVDRVKPFIDSAYRTKPGRDHTFTGGSSAGGIISFMLVWEHPGVFSKAICMSPAFVSPAGNSTTWNYAEVVLKSKKRKGVFFYIDNGGIELDALLQPGVDEMLTALKKKGYREGKDFVFVRDPAATHFEAAWAKRFPAALEILMKR